MARLFTVNFCFKGKNYSAIVSFREQSEHPDFLVRYTHEDLITVIPEGRVSINLDGGERSSNGIPGLAGMLIDQTTEAIMSHLNVKGT